MKPTTTLSKATMILLIAGAAIFSNGASAQNMLTNPGFQSGTNGWSTDCSIEINPETVYGGTNASNNVTEIDIERCFNQQVTVSAGTMYDFSYKASRRTGGGTPATVGVNVTITGVQSGTQYLNTNRTYSNTTWGYVTENFSFTLPSTATDTRLNIKFSNYATTSTYGTLVDDIDFHIDPTYALLPIKLTSFAGQLKDHSAALSWVANNDDNDGRYFVIERAAAQGGFDSIGRVAAHNGGSYSFTDSKMLSGSNNYRLKMVSRASSTYSKVIGLDNAMSEGVQVYPNPATSAIQVVMKSFTNNSVSVTIFSLSGSVVATKQIQLSAGLNKANLDITSLQKGSFFLKISDGGALNYVQEFCKR